MQRIGGLILCVFLAGCVLWSGCVAMGGGQTRPQGALTDGEITSGLKEALIVGTVNAVLKVSKKDGYFGNNLIRIPLPESVRDLEGPLRAAGFGPRIDAFVLSMNRAAERAAPKAKEIFIGAAKKMTFADARRILFGGDNEATLYFKRHTAGKITTAFKPIVRRAISEVGVTRDYQRLSKQLAILTLGQVQAVDLDDYVTGLAVDGLFLMVAAEERKIREDPVARVSEILKKVFGGV